MPTILHTPPCLYHLAHDAERERDHVHLSPDEVRAIADCWHSDREKVKHLEALIVRCARGGDIGPPVLTMPPMDAQQRKHLAAMLLRGFGDGGGT